MNKKNRVRAAITLAIGTALLFPVASSAQVSTLVTEAGRLLDQQAKISLPKYKRVIPPRTGSLESQSEVEQTFSLKRGQEYGFLAIGDETALDVDLQVVDSGGVEVAVDRREDEVAVATFKPKKAGKYLVRTIMYDCQSDACEYALGTYRKEIMKKKKK